MAVTEPKVAVITGADRGLGLALAGALAGRGWRVFAGRYLADWPDLDELVSRHEGLVTVMPLDVASMASAAGAAALVARQVARVDLLISNAGVNSPSRTLNIRDGLDYDEMQRLYDVNALGGLRAVQAFVSLMESSPVKRLCFVSSEAGSIARARRQAWHSYCMSKAALNMGVKLLHNHLRPDGFCFRVYHPGWIRSWIGGTGVRADSGGTEPAAAAEHALAHFLGDVPDEDGLTMHDWKGESWPW